MSRDRGRWGERSLSLLPGVVSTFHVATKLSFRDGGYRPAFPARPESERVLHGRATKATSLLILLSFFFLTRFVFWMKSWGWLLTFPGDMLVIWTLQYRS